MTARKHFARLLPTPYWAFLLLWAGMARGAWQFVPEILIEAEANDNPRLLADSPELAPLTDDAATRVLAEVRLQFANATPRGAFAVEPSVRSDAYADAGNDDLKSTDTFLQSSGEYRWERAVAGFSADIAREKLLGTEFLSAQPSDIDFDDPTVIDSVLLGLNERRNRRTLSPYTERAVGSQGTVRLDGRFMDVGYDGDPVSARTDFQDLQLGAEYIRRMSPRSTLSGRIFGAAFEADANSNDTDTVGVGMRYSKEMSSIWSLNVSWGLEQSDFRYVDPTTGPQTGTDDNATFGLGLRKRTEFANLNVDLQRQVNPDSFGFLAARNQLRFALQRQMSRALGGTIALRAIETEGIRGVIAGDRSYGRVELGIDWAFAELWSFVAGYEYSTRQINSFELDAGDASSNAISLGFSYQGRTRR
jgi:hypothetical protein